MGLSLKPLIFLSLALPITGVKDLSAQTVDRTQAAPRVTTDAVTTFQTGTGLNLTTSLTTGGVSTGTLSGGKVVVPPGDGGGGTIPTPTCTSDPNPPCIVCENGQIRVKAGISCDDKNACTSGETCNSSGVCGSPTSTVTCNTPPNTQCYLSSGTCSTTDGSCSYSLKPNVPSTGTPTTETCNGIDDDCNGIIDDGVTVVDDGNPCTLDICTAGAPAHPAGNAGASCRASAGVCDVAETCNGTSTSCPTDGFLGSGTSCRASANECDLAESCSGTGAACPADTKKADGTALSAAATDANPCTLDICTAGAPAHPAGNAGASCRASAGTCDVAETCDGTSTTCPGDTVVAAGTTCPTGGADTNPCTDDTCDGTTTNKSCNHPNNTASCAVDAYSCTDDVCSGGACTHPGGTGSSTCCLSDTDCSDGNACNGNETCNTTSHTCVAGIQVTCTPSDTCHTSTCNTATGACAETVITSMPDTDNDGTKDACDTDNCTGKTCSPSDTCHEAGQCDPTTGQCGTGAAINGCCTTDSQCADTNACNGTETCDTAGHTCAPGTPIATDDNNPCTDDSCVTDTGQRIPVIAHTPKAEAECSDPQDTKCDLDTCKWKDAACTLDCPGTVASGGLARCTLTTEYGGAIGSLACGDLSLDPLVPSQELQTNTLAEETTLTCTGEAGGKVFTCSDTITVSECVVSCEQPNGTAGGRRETTVGLDADCKVTEKPVGYSCSSTDANGLMEVDTSTAGVRRLSTTCTGERGLPTITCYDDIMVNPSCDGFQVLLNGAELGDGTAHEGDLLSISPKASGHTSCDMTINGSQVSYTTTPASHTVAGQDEISLTATCYGNDGTNVICTPRRVPVAPPNCGNGILETGETCDDGNDINTDSCISCQPARCGDGFVQEGVEEECDAGQETEDCSADCKIKECGDGAINRRGEECDDGNTAEGDGCSPVCQHEPDCISFTPPSASLYHGQSTSVTVTGRGTGACVGNNCQDFATATPVARSSGANNTLVLQNREITGQAVAASGLQLRTAYRIANVSETRVGVLTAQVPADTPEPERSVAIAVPCTEGTPATSSHQVYVTDTGTASFQAFCNGQVEVTCQSPCGNGQVDPGETCDPPNADTCDADCRTIPTTPSTTQGYCGDGNQNPPGEECDDGNTVSGDGCSEACQIEEKGDRCAGSLDMGCLRFSCVAPQQVDHYNACFERNKEKFQTIRQVPPSLSTDLPKRKVYLSYETLVKTTPPPTIDLCECPAPQPITPITVEGTCTTNLYSLPCLTQKQAEELVQKGFNLDTVDLSETAIGYRITVTTSERACRKIGGEVLAEESETEGSRDARCRLTKPECPCETPETPPTTPPVTPPEEEVEVTEGPPTLEEQPPQPPAAVQPPPSAPSAPAVPPQVLQPEPPPQEAPDEVFLCRSGASFAVGTRSGAEIPISSCPQLTAELALSQFHVDLTQRFDKFLEKRETTQLEEIRSKAENIIKRWKQGETAYQYYPIVAAMEPTIEPVGTPAGEVSTEGEETPPAEVAVVVPITPDDVDIAELPGQGMQIHIKPPVAAGGPPETAGPPPGAGSPGSGQGGGPPPQAQGPQSQGQAAAIAIPDNDFYELLAGANDTINTRSVILVPTEWLHVEGGGCSLSTGPTKRAPVWTIVLPILMMAAWRSIRSSINTPEREPSTKN